MKTRLLLLIAAIATGTPLLAGTQYTIIGNATSAGARGARGELVLSGGFIFGASRYGGANGFGSLFRFDPATGNYVIKRSFADGADGKEPASGIVKANDGQLYGVNAGGANGVGTLFRITEVLNTFSTPRPFANASGGTPDCAPIQATDGKLYGVTGTGGNGFGGIYQVNLDGTGYSLIHTFNGTAMAPFGKGAGCGGLVEGPDPTMLYGCARTGGTPGDTGLSFVATKNGGGFNFMHAFEAPGLIKPCNRLLLASDGNFYGAADEGGAANKGGLFRLTPDGDYTTLREFANDLDGFGVYSPLIEGSDGYLYGCASSSSNTMGSVFRMSKDGTSFAVLHRFTGGTSDGAQPGSPLLEASPGLFYGTAFTGGTTLDGIFFKIETTVEAPKVTVTGSLRPLFRGRTLRLRGSASDDLGVLRVEYATKGAFKPAKGTTAWNARIPVKPSVNRLTVRVRSVDSETLVSAVKTVRARRKS